MFPSYKCLICRQNFEIGNPEFKPYRLSCGHIYCEDCLNLYLSSKIQDGDVHPKCFAEQNPSYGQNEKEFTTMSSTLEMELNTDFQLKANDSVQHQFNETNQLPAAIPNELQPCNTVLTHDEISDLIGKDLALLTKYKRFKFFSDHPTARECPNTNCLHLQIGSDVTPEMLCEK
jgi:hypothetical protein